MGQEKRLQALRLLTCVSSKSVRKLHLINILPIGDEKQPVGVAVETDAAMLD